MRGDGDGWVVSESGTYHWGVYGAAGLLLRAPLSTDEPAVLLQHRALWSHQGGTWALPGGAMDLGETPWRAALREAHEEAGLSEEHITHRATVVTAEVTATGGGRWTYSTVIADARETLQTVANRESVELRWVPESEVALLPLHPGFAESWKKLRTMASVPPHECEFEPHTLVIEESFAWCSAGISPAPL